ncbi:hypothetical protein AB0M47_40535 [Hamadaea sp. NPDC051192]|uniref:hypothetical protein n=1 Tax=Hamadaea sp. NPDC051192 TaxID=3154940 RepID=UPI003412C034
MIGEPPPSITDDDILRLRILGNEVKEALTGAGLPATFVPEPAGPPPVTIGACIRIDQYNSSVVYIEWEIGPALRRRAAMLPPRDFTHPDARVAVVAALAMGEAMRRILVEAGFEADLGYDMAPGAVWVRRPDDQRR